MPMEKFVKRIQLAVIMAGGMVFASLAAHAAGVKVIANPGIAASSISADDLKSVFLEEKSSLSDGTHVEPVLEKGGAAHEEFVKQYLDKTDSALQTYYRSLVFTGKGSMPKAVGSDAEVAAYVAKTKGAIGYVSAGADVAGVKTLEVK
jgi:ABC-type phosphate transport system substrate-binding protein